MLKSVSKLKAGDKVAVLSPSTGTAGLFPWVFDYGLDRLRSLFGFEVIEYPTTRQFGSSLEDRAEDILNAFADTEVKAIFAAIGGSDQIQLLKCLDEVIVRHNPKPFFGYSDNTHLHNYLWKLDIPTYYGGAIMTQFAMPDQMDEQTKKSLMNAINQEQNVLMESSDYFTEIDLDWASEKNLKRQKLKQNNYGFAWDIKLNDKVSGRLWGGCVESMVTLLCADHAPKNEELDGAVLFLETSETVPELWVVRYILVALGERGLLERFNAILFGRAKAWSFHKKLPVEDRDKYREEQEKIVIDTVRQYNKTAPIIQNMDFGHTDPQSIVPSGNTAIIDPSTRSIWFNY